MIFKVGSFLAILLADSIIDVIVIYYLINLKQIQEWPYRMIRDIKLINAQKGKKKGRFDGNKIKCFMLLLYKKEADKID